jgi:hypothetical protein
VLAFVIFLFYNARLALLTKDPLFASCFFLILALNPYLLDFFSIARGYGISIAFLTAAVFYLHQTLYDGGTKANTLLCISFSVLSVLANFTLIYFFFAAASLALYAKRNLFPPRIFWLLASCVFFISILFALYLLRLKSAGALFYGGDTGFYNDTLNSLVYSSLHHKSYSYISQAILKLFVILFFLFSLIYSISTFKKSEPLEKQNFVVVPIFLLTGCIVASILGHYIFGSKFFIQRTALFLVPLFNLLVVFAWPAPSGKSKAAIVALALLVLFNFFNNYTKRSVFEWYLAEQDNKRIENLVKP